MSRRAPATRAELQRAVNMAAIEPRPQIAADTLGIPRQTYVGWLTRAEREGALIDMRLNLGSGGFREFVTMIAAVKAGKWASVAAAALASKAAAEEPSRFKTLAALLRTGEWETA